MRTTLDLDDQLLHAARLRAKELGSTLTAVVEEALASLLAPRPAGAKAFQLKLKTDHGRYIGGVDLANRDALYDIMEGDASA